jgi:hypothetical protein
MSRRFVLKRGSIEDSDDEGTKDEVITEKDEGITATDQGITATPPGIFQKTSDDGKTSVESVSDVSARSEDNSQMQLLGIPYPYFYHSWASYLFKKTDDVKEVFHIDNSNLNKNNENVYIWNKQSKDNCTNFLDEHKKYGNSLQNYYTVVDQRGELPENWQSTGEINITSITPIYLQKCENIMSTLLFMPLDQCHDFRGGRTSEYESWVTTSKKSILKSSVNSEEVDQGITSNIYTNEFMNTLVHTSFSGMKDIIGIMVIGDESFELIKQSQHLFDNGNLNYQNIMLQLLGIDFSISNDIVMNCNPAGNHTKFQIDGKEAMVLFLGFTSDGWDRGMHAVWSMNEKKHIFSIKIDKISKSEADSTINVIYSGNKITEFQNIVPCYEMIYKDMKKTGFINEYKLNGQSLSVQNIDSLFESGNLNTLYETLLDELYRSKNYVNHIEKDDEEETTGGSESQGNTDVESQSSVNSTDVIPIINPETETDTKEDFLYRGATYRFYGVRAPDSKKLALLGSQEKILNIAYESIFIQILKKMSKNIYPKIHSSFAYPEITDIPINNDTALEQINDRIKAVNDLFNNGNNGNNIMTEYPIVYDQEKYNQLEQLQDNCTVNDNENKFIIKQFGTVNDMNIAPTIDRVMNSLNCSNNCDIINETKDDNENDDPNDINNPNNPENPKYINKVYPYRFQLVSGVLDSSLQGGENMPEYFPPEIDIFMTIFDNQGELQGIIVRMTFLETILRNSSNVKNSAKVFSHFTYIGFDEIDLKPITQKLGGENWKLNSENYPLALKYLLYYIVNNTTFILSKAEDLVSKFNTNLNNGIKRNWYYYYSDNVGPSVSQGINNVVIKIFNNELGIIKDDNTDISESIVKVAQKIYNDCEILRNIFTPSNPGAKVDRSYQFESIFLLRIKYIGDKSRCTDSLFLNKNKFAECMQITGDENAYFTALINGASTIFSPPSKFAFYFAPYFTYGNVNSEGKFLLNLPIYKNTLLKGESPTGFKSSSKGKSKSTNTNEIIPIDSEFIKEEGEPLWRNAKELTRFIKDLVMAAYGECLVYITNFETNIRNEVVIENKNKNILETNKKISAYKSYYVEVEQRYGTITGCKNSLVSVFDRLKELNVELLPPKNLKYSDYYNNIITKLNEVFLTDDKDFQVEKFELEKKDYNNIKDFIIDFLNKAIAEIDSRLNGPNISSKINEIYLKIKGEYKKIVDKFNVIEDSSEFGASLIELTEYYRTTISPLGKKVTDLIPWDVKINDICNFVSSLKDMSSFIFPETIKCIKAYYDQVKKYKSLDIEKYVSEIAVIKTEIAKIKKLERAEKAASEPILPSQQDVSKQILPSQTDLSFVNSKQKRNLKGLQKQSLEDNNETSDANETIQKQTPLLGRKQSAKSAPEAIGTTVKAGPAQKGEEQEGTRRSSRETRQSSKYSSGGGKIDQESYRKNQIYILKCFSSIMSSNDSKYNNLITSDKLNIKYDNIDNIDKYCVSLLMLQINYFFKGYNPNLESIQNIINDISILDEEKTPIDQVIGIRNYYSPIINNYIDIEYLQLSSDDYILGINGVELLTEEDVIYKLFNSCQINYYMLEFIINNLKIINTPQNTYLDETNSKNFSVITQMFDIIENIDVDMMSIYYGLNQNKAYLNSSTKLSSEEKNLYDNQITISNNYISLCLFFIKYCNQVLISLTNNMLKYSNSGLLCDYSPLLNEFSNDGFTNFVNDFNNLNIILTADVKNIFMKLVNLSQTEDLNSYIKSAIDITSPINSTNGISKGPTNRISEGPTNGISKGPIEKSYEPLKNSTRSLSSLSSLTSLSAPKFQVNRSQVNRSQGGTFKIKNNKKYNKTKNSKKINKKRTIKKRKNIKKYNRTKKH